MAGCQIGRAETDAEVKTGIGFARGAAGFGQGREEEVELAAIGGGTGITLAAGECISDMAMSMVCEVYGAERERLCMP